MIQPHQRKQNSIAQLIAKQIPYIDHLPMIESSQDANKRSIEEIAQRAVSCLIVIQAACDINANKYDQDTQVFIQELLEKYQVADQLTAKEQAIVHNQVERQQDVVNMVWKYEAYWVLLWALGIVEELNFPNDTIDCDVAIKAVSSCQNLQEFIAQVQLRDLEQILDEADLIYRYDWACVDARLKQQKPPANLNSSVVVERHAALNWLIGHDEDWDHPNVST